MKLEVKYFSSPDIFDFEKFVPLHSNSFNFLLEFEVGILGKSGGDLFSVEVCTPNWFQENINFSEITFCNKKLIVFKYDINSIMNKIVDYISSINANSWEEAIAQISSIANWEFDNYRK